MAAPTDFIGPWPAEALPDDGLLYYRVHRTQAVGNAVRPGAFANRPNARPSPPNGMSTSWTKYSTAVETQQGGRIPSDNGVVSLIAAAVRGIGGQTVEHTPRQENRAHTDVFGEKSPEVRLKLARLVNWVIPVPAQVT
jgi:hypothetical protein